MIKQMLLSKELVSKVFLTRRELTNDRDANVADLVKVGETLEVLVLRQVVGKDTDTVTYPCI